MTWTLQKGIKSLPWSVVKKLLNGLIILCIVSVIILLRHNKIVSLKQKFSMDGQKPFEPYTLSKKGGYNPTAQWEKGPLAVQRTAQMRVGDPRYTLVEVPLREDRGPLQSQVELLTPYNCPYFER